MEKVKEDVVASFDFGANGKIELTSTKLFGSVISYQTMAMKASERKATMKGGVRSEFRAKLDQVQNFEIQGPRSTWGKIWKLMTIFAYAGLLPITGGVLIGLAIGLVFRSASATVILATLGGLGGVCMLIWMYVMTWKAAGRAYLIFSVNGSDMNVSCEGSRLSELEAFVQTVKRTQEAYIDSL